MIWSERGEERQVRSSARKWSLGKFLFDSGFRREKFSSLVQNLNTARLKVERKIYHAAKYNSFLFSFPLNRTWGKIPRLKVDGNYGREGQRRRRSGFFLLFFFFFSSGVSCVNLTCLVTSEVINDFIFFILVRGRRRTVIPFEQTFMAYAIVDSYN